MANFIVAHKRTAINEGGYANDPVDRGGETYKGIARKFHPHWVGWKTVDEYRRKPNFPKNLSTAPGLEELIHSFYKKNFWDILKGDKIRFQPMANSLYDDAVNTGNTAAIRKLQNVLFNLPLTDKEKRDQIRLFNIDYGTMDDITLSKLNSDIL